MVFRMYPFDKIMCNNLQVVHQLHAALDQCRCHWIICVADLLFVLFRAVESSDLQECFVNNYILSIHGFIYKEVC